MISGSNPAGALNFFFIDQIARVCISQLIVPCKTSPSSFNFGMAGLNLGRWAEKEQARRKFTRPVEQNYKSKQPNTSKIILPHGFKYDQNKTPSSRDFGYVCSRRRVPCVEPSLICTIHHQQTLLTVVRRLGPSRYYRVDFYDVILGSFFIFACHAFEKTSILFHGNRSSNIQKYYSIHCRMRDKRSMFMSAVFKNLIFLHSF